MMERPMRTLAVSAASGRLGAVFITEDGAGTTKLSRVNARSPRKAKQQLHHWILDFGPDFLICEDVHFASKKGKRTKKVLQAIAETFHDADGNDLVVRRTKHFANKYEEAEALAKRYPFIRSHLPERPPIWMPEPRCMALFEALALYDAVHSKE